MVYVQRKSDRLSGPSDVERAPEPVQVHLDDVNPLKVVSVPEEAGNDQQPIANKKKQGAIREKREHQGKAREENRHLKHKLQINTINVIRIRERLVLSRRKRSRTGEDREEKTNDSFVSLLLGFESPEKHHDGEVDVDVMRHDLLVNEGQRLGRVESLKLLLWKTPIDQKKRENDPKDEIKERGWREGREREMPRTRMSACVMVEFCIILFAKKKREAEVIRRVENRKLYTTWDTRNASTLKVMIKATRTKTLCLLRATSSVSSLPLFSFSLFIAATNQSRTAPTYSSSGWNVKNLS